MQSRRLLICLKKFYITSSAHAIFFRKDTMTHPRATYLITLTDHMTHLTRFVGIE